MIEITPQWSVYRDKYQWVLVESYEGKDGRGNPKTHKRETYHPWLDHAMRYAADRSCEGAESLQAIAAVYQSLQEAVSGRVGAVEAYYRDVLKERDSARGALRDSRKAIKRLKQEKVA